MFATVTNVVKNFACGELFSFLYFNFVHDFIHYLCANCDKCCKNKKVRLRRAFDTPIFQFRQFLALETYLLKTFLKILRPYTPRKNVLTVQDNGVEKLQTC